MNALYIGLENPVSISVPGAKEDEIECTFEGATARKIRPGLYIVMVNNSVREVIATAAVNGNIMGTAKFRIKNVPKPFPLFGNKGGGKISPREVNTQTIIWVGLGPEFLFDGMRYTVTKSTLVFNQKGKESKLFIVNR